MSYFVKAGGEYLARSSCDDIWTENQREAYRFNSVEMAEECARSWRTSSYVRLINARVVLLVPKKKNSELT